MRDRIGPLIVAAAALAGCEENVVPEWCIAPEDVAVRLASEPGAWGSPPELSPEWRVDGAAQGQELVLPTSAAVSGAAGRIALVDFGLREVVVIGLDGKWVGRWGRSGSGPGELTAPYVAAWRPDGRLVVFDPARSRLVVFDGEGEAESDVPVDAAFTAALGGGVRWIQMDGSGLLLAQPGPAYRGEGDTRTLVVVRGGPVGEPVDTLALREAPVVLVPNASPVAAPGWTVPAAAIHGDSIVAVAGDQPEYMIRVFRSGRLTHVICRDVDPLPFGSEEAEPQEPNVPDAVTAAMARAETPSTPARLGRLAIDDDRRLWVQRERPRALSGLDLLMGRQGALHDVYDADGRYLGEVRMPPNVRFLGATGDLIVGLETDELDVLSVVAFRARDLRVPSDAANAAAGPYTRR